jgi:hypothetical protein
MNEVRFIDVEIPAAGAARGFVPLRVPGRIITCVQTNAPFVVQPDNGDEVDMNTGRASGSENGREFGTLNFYNAAGVIVTARLAISYRPYQPDSSVASINATITSTGRNAPTTATGYTGNIGAGATVVFADALQTRKSWSVFNNHATDDLHVRGANGILMHVVPARQGYPVECGGTIQLHNPGANPITYAACEVRYV